MELDKEFIEKLKFEVEQIVEDIQEKQNDTLADDLMQKMKNNWNEERLQKTEEILNSYKGLKDFIANVNFTDKEYDIMEKQQIKTVMKNNFTDNETFLERIFKSKVNTEILVTFLTQVFTEYINEKTDSRVIADIRKAQMLKEMYMEGIKPSEVKVGYSSPKTFYKDKEELIDELTPRILGIFGIKFEDKKL